MSDNSVFWSSRESKGFSIVTPAEAGVQRSTERLDSRFRGNDIPKGISISLGVQSPL
jgi:hypothetical protein